MQVAAHYHFVPKLEEENICKPWLTVKPRFGMLLPGDAVEISFTILVDTKTAQVDPATASTHSTTIMQQRQDQPANFHSYVSSHSRDGPRSLLARLPWLPPLRT